MWIRELRMLFDMEEVANQECTCTEAQQSGEDPTECLSCHTGNDLNEIVERLEQAHQRLIRERYKNG